MQQKSPLSTDIIRGLTVKAISSHMGIKETTKRNLEEILRDQNNELIQERIETIESELENCKFLLETITGIKSDEMKKDLQKCDFGGYIGEMQKYIGEMQMSENKNKENEISKKNLSRLETLVIIGILKWLKKTKILTKKDKKFLIHKIKISKILRTKANEGWLSDSLKQILSIQQILGIEYIGRAILDTESFKYFINNLLKQKDKNYKFGMLDLDYFKNINDIFGHNFGDFALKSFFLYINQTNSDGIRFRYGGEEVGIVCDKSVIGRLKEKCGFEIDLRSNDDEIKDDPQFKALQYIARNIKKLPINQEMFFHDISELRTTMFEENPKYDTIGTAKKAEGKEDLQPKYIKIVGNKEDGYEIIFGKKGSRSSDTQKGGQNPSFTWKVKSNKLFLTFSGGFTKIDTDSFMDQANTSKTINEADALLYRAKQEGRAQICSGEKTDECKST